MGLLWRSGRREADEEFVAFYTARGKDLRNTAYLLCGDWHLAEDLTQITFTKLYRAWHRIQRHDVLDQFARRVLLHAFLDERRRPWRREFSTVPESPVLDTVAPEQELQGNWRLEKALAELSKQHRAVLVLRFWADLSVEQVAEILGCSAGTVKSQTSRGLASLREALGIEQRDLEQPKSGGRL